MKTAAERKRDERKRMRKKGFALRQVWVHREDWPLVGKYLADVNERRAETNEPRKTVLSERFQLNERCRAILAKALGRTPESISPEIASRLRRRQLMERTGCGPADAKAIRNWLVANGFHWGERKAGQFRQERL